MEPTTSELATGGGAILGTALVMKILDKVPLAKIFGSKKGIDKDGVALMVAAHKEECMVCVDKKISDQVTMFLQWRREDIEERREFRREVLESNKRVHERLDKLLETRH